MGIPKLGSNGSLPRGVHRATLAQLRRAFGRAGARRVVLMNALGDLVRRARRAGVSRVLVNGSFVTARREPRDVDLVLLLPGDFMDRVRRGDRDARWIRDIAVQDPPGVLDVHVAIDGREWDAWARFFQQDVWTGRKGVVEVIL